MQKRVLAASYFCATGVRVTLFFFFILSFSRDNKSARALRRANERVDFYHHTSRHLREELLSSVAFYLCSSFERARKRSLLLHIGYIEESIQSLHR